MERKTSTLDLILFGNPLEILKFKDWKKINDAGAHHHFVIQNQRRLMEEIKTKLSAIIETRYEEIKNARNR